MLSVFDIFKIGIGPSSSHTVGPMRIARRFVLEAADAGKIKSTDQVHIELQGSLALTGIGHACDKAVILGLLGFDPQDIDPDEADASFEQIKKGNRLQLFGGPEVDFQYQRDLDFRGDIIPDLHPNGVHLMLKGADGEVLFDQTYYSVGGGFIASAKQLSAPAVDDLIDLKRPARFSFSSARELLELCSDHSLSIEELLLQNEDDQRPRDETYDRLDAIWRAMSSCITRGLTTSGVLPGGLSVVRRAPGLYQKLMDAPHGNEREQLFDWLNVYAMAVNEENAAGGRVVTAPTNGAAGVIPSVIKHYCCDGEENTAHIRRFLVVAAGIGMLYKQRASISGAEMGCQGEVGVACSMAAAGLAAVWGGTPSQIERAAEIGMEHNLGLTCDPVGGLVQIPCIERNAIGAVKAVNAARLALRAAESHKVSLDQVIETMRQTGLDMSRKYKETSEGGLAVNVVEC